MDPADKKSKQDKKIKKKKKKKPSNPPDDEPSDDGDGDNDDSDDDDSSGSGDQTLQNKKSKWRSTDGREAATIKFDSYPGRNQWKHWWELACSHVAGRSARPKLALKWMFAIEKAKSVEDLEDDEGFETLDAKLRDAWNAITKGILVKEIQLADKI